MRYQEPETKSHGWSSSPFLLSVSLCLCVFVLNGKACAGEGKLFELRGSDKVYFKDNNLIVEGVVTETDTAGEFKIRDKRTGTARTFTMADIKDWKKEATPDTELVRLWKNPDARLRVAREAVSDYEQLTPKVIELLEKDAGSNVEMLALLCELYLRTGQTGPAQKVADSLVAGAPTQARSYLLRGQLYVALGKLDEADKDLEKAFNMAPENPDVVVARADLFLKKGLPEEATKMFAAALAKNPQNVAALVGKGMVALRQGDFVEAEQALKDALAIDRNHKQALLGLAGVKVMTGKFDDAFSIGKDIQNLDNQCAEAFGIQAFAKLLAGDRDSLAIFSTKLKDALNLKSNQPRLVLASAAALEREAKFQEALNTPEGLTAAKQKRDEAAAKYKEILDTDPPDAYLQYFIGERWFREGDYRKAETAFLRAAKMSPRYAPAQAAVGAVSLRLAKWDVAREAYAQAIKLDDQAGEYYAGKGLSLLKAKLFEEAAVEFRKALELERHNTTALCGLGYIKNYEVNKNSAIEFFQQALAADGSCEYAADALTKIFAQEGKTLEYLTFNDNVLPPLWKPRVGGATIRPVVMNGQVVFSGTQGTAQGGKTEIYKDVKVEEFERLEADLEMLPTSPVTFGLRIASATLVATNFELEFGKDESNEIKIRYKDFGGQPAVWQSLPQKKEWPAEGRVRLALSTDDLKSGKVHLWINGKELFEVPLSLQKLSRITVGAFVQPPPKEAVQASVDNIVLVLRGAQNPEKEGGEGIKVLGDKQAAPDKKPAPDAKTEPGKEKAP